jgi:hypothetical protein
VTFWLFRGDEIPLQGPRESVYAFRQFMKREVSVMHEGAEEPEIETPPSDQVSDQADGASTEPVDPPAEEHADE